MCQSWHLVRSEAFSLLLLVSQVMAGNLISVLQTFDELSTLNFHINASQNLFNTLSAANNITLIAPSDTAFDAFFGSLAPADPSEDEIETLLTYHLLFGGWPSATFMKQTTFVPTFLNDSALANVTGGQVVGLLADATTGKPTFISGNKTITPIAQQVSSDSLTYPSNPKVTKW